MDDIITGIARRERAVSAVADADGSRPGAVSAYLTEQEAAQTDGSADTSSDAESADSTDDSTDDTSATLIQPVNYVYIGTATISAQGN